MPKLRCVTYKDAFSANGCSFTDLEIGMAHTAVGCNSKVFGSSRPGDLVIITANNGRRRYFTAGILLERLVECSLWAAAGGHTWEYNFLYRPLTGCHEITPTIKERVTALCEPLIIDPAYFFHSRFCGERYLPVLRTLLQELPKETPGS
jgi:hypothetical protein